jgi:hypothetical protein
MKTGESKHLPAGVPRADYHGKDVAGKTSRLHGHREEDRSRRNLPEVNEQLAKSLGIARKAASKPCAPTSSATWSAKSSSACWPATRRPPWTR